MIGIMMLRENKGCRMWSVHSDNLEDAMKDVMAKLYESQTTFKNNDPVIEVKFTLRKKLYQNFR